MTWSDYDFGILLELKHINHYKKNHEVLENIKDLG